MTSGPGAAPTPEELVQLADGSLPLARRAEVEAWLLLSPELARDAELQRRAVGALRGVQVRAPARLRARVEGARRLGEARRRRVRVRAAGATIAASSAAIVALALVIALGGERSEEGPRRSPR